MRVVVDRSRCSIIGICESLAPETFEVGDDGSLVVLNAEVSHISDALADAVRSCPAMALSVVDDQGAKVP